MHAFSLVIGSILSHQHIAGVVKNCQRIVTYFKHSHQPAALLAKEAKERGINSGLVTSNTTRFTSVCMCLESVLKLRRVLESLAERQPAVISKREVKAVILDDGHWATLQVLVSLLRPFCLVVTAIQSKTALLADVFRYFLFLAAEIRRQVADGKLSSELAKHVCAAYNTRYKEIVDPVVVLALVLHPRYRAAAAFFRAGQRELLGTAQRLLSKFGKASPEAVSSLNTSFLEYLGMSGAFSLSEAPVDATTNPTTWWRQIARGHMALVFVALRLLEVVPHAADVERIFSMLGWFQSDRRCNLGDGSLEKVAKVKVHMDAMR